MTMRALKIAFAVLIVLCAGMRSDAQTSELFGHVTLVEGYAVPNFTGAHALVQLRDTPGKTIAALTTEHRLQTLLETALSTGNLVAIHGAKLTNPPSPNGGKWSVDVYKIDTVILYNVK